MNVFHWWLSLRGRWLFWLITLLSAASLSCFSFEIALRFEHKQGEQGELHGRIGMHLTDQYLTAAKTANQERAADYQAAGLDAPEPLFPVTWEEFDEAGFDTADLLEGDVEIIEQSDKGYTIGASKIYTESKGLGVTDNSLVLQVDRSDPALIRYTLDMDILDLSEEFDPADMDELRNEGLGPKPAIETAPADVEIDAGEEDLGTEIITGVLEEMFGAVPDLGGLELDSWYAKKVMLASGMPIMSYSVELPGKITSHTLAGETVGAVELPGNRVVLVVDENFLQRSGPKSGTLRITSELHKCNELCTKTEHMVWDGVSPPDSCQCKCEDGWTKAADGKSCVQLSGHGRIPLYPARNIENTDQFEALLRSRGYSEEHCLAHATYPPGSVILWNLGGRIAHSSVMTKGDRQIEMGDKPGGKRYVSELLSAGTNPAPSGNNIYGINEVLCPPPGTIFNSVDVIKDMHNIDRNYGEPDKWNCHGFSANVVARYGKTGVHIEPGSKYHWEGSKLILESGRVYVKDNHAFEVQLKGGTLHPQSEYLIEVDEAGGAYLYVMQGSVTIDGEAASTVVTTGQYVVIDPTGAQSGIGSFDVGNISPWWREMDVELFKESGPGFEQIIRSPTTWYWIGGILCGSGLLGLALTGVVFKRRRRHMPTPTQDPPTVKRFRRPGTADPFASAEQRFTHLLSAYRSGKIDQDQWQKEVGRLMVKDSAGNYWGIGGKDGRWYWYDGANWVPKDRPR